MRATQLHTICIMTLLAILFVGIEASSATQDWNMEASAGCAETDCMFRGQTLAMNSGVAKLQKINIFAANGMDPRVQMDRAVEAVKPFLPAGSATTDNAVTGFDNVTSTKKSNAFLVSPCYALTEYHSVFGKARNASQDYTMTIKLGAGELADGFRYELKMKPVSMSSKASSGRDGLVLMQLEKCAGKKLGWMNLSIPGANKLVGRTVGLAGFHGDKATTKLSVQNNCKIHALDKLSGLLMHDCSALPGTSSSMMYEYINGVPTVVAMHYGGTTKKSGVLKAYSHGDANLALPMDMLNENPEMMKIIEEDIAAFGQANPATIKTAPVKTQLAALSTT